jgi:hypothetical protein
MQRMAIAAATTATAKAVPVTVQALTTRKCDRISNIDADLVNYRIMR